MGSNPHFGSGSCGSEETSVVGRWLGTEFRWRGDFWSDVVGVTWARDGMAGDVAAARGAVVAMACALLFPLSQPLILRPDEGKRLSDPRCKMRIWVQEADAQAQQYEDTKIT